MARKIDLIVIHCSAASIENQTAAMIDRWHRQRGWKKIGYHYFIRTNGLIESGRPVEEVGAHVKGHNANSIGICLAGGKRGDFTGAQYASLQCLLRSLLRIWPDARVAGHREFNPHKTCPIIEDSWWKRARKEDNKWTIWKLLKQFLQSLVGLK